MTAAIQFRDESRLGKRSRDTDSLDEGQDYRTEITGIAELHRWNLNHSLVVAPVRIVEHSNHERTGLNVKKPVHEQ